MLNNLKSARSGSELLFENLMKRLDASQTDGINLILNSTHESHIKEGHVNIVWMHHNVNENATLNFANKNYLKKIDYFVFVSHWQYEKFRYKYNIPEYKSLVIKNAAEEIKLSEKPKKIKLIYTSTPFRGLDILLDSFERLDRDDVELDIFSSTKIYGKEYDEKAGPLFTSLFDRAKKTKNVNYHGFASNSSVRKALENAHIFSYPSIFEETSCMSAIEAGMAGLSLVTTNFGALYETCASWARYISFDSNRSNLILKYSFALNKAIDEYWDPKNQQKLQDQSRYFNQFYGWDGRIKEWENFLNQIKKT